MRLPWQRRSESTATREARMGAELAQVRLNSARAKRAEAQRLAEIGRRQRECNHFGEGIERAMRRRFAS